MTSSALGIDVGGTQIKACIADIDGSVLQEWRFDTDASRGADAVVATIVNTARELAAQADDLVGIGLAVPGRVDELRGIALHSSNIGWRDVALRDLVAEATGAPVRLGHDVRAGSLAEDRWGAARQHPTSLFLPIGTGLAVSFVADGRALTGANWVAGDIGHLPLAPEAQPCGCGRTRCLEAYSSARSIARRYAALSGTAATAQDVARLVDAGDPIATRVWTDAVEAIAVALTLVATVVDPHVIVIGGGLSEAGDTLMRPLADALRSEPDIARRLTTAQFGARSGMVGAAALAWANVS